MMNKYFDKKDKETGIFAFINKFSDLTPKKAIELRAMLENLGLMKLKKES